MVLRQANINDCELYFDWVNDKIVRKYAFDTNTIEWQDHQEWFNDKLKDSNSYLYIAENNQDIIGQVRFDCKNEKAVMHYSISCDFRGKGLGRQLVARALEKIKKDCLSVNIVEAKVKVDNIASRKIFLGLNFNKQNTTEQVVTYQLLLVG